MKRRLYLTIDVEVTKHRRCGKCNLQFPNQTVCYLCIECRLEDKRETFGKPVTKSEKLLNLESLTTKILFEVISQTDPLPLLVSHLDSAEGLKRFANICDTILSILKLKSKSINKANIVNLEFRLIR